MELNLTDKITSHDPEVSTAKEEIEFARELVESLDIEEIGSSF
jgi:hypothetical protein